MHTDANANTTPRGSRIIPTLRYQDAPAAIEWLCRAFGFERHAVYGEENGTVAHAQLVLPGGGGMIMLGTDDPSRELSAYQRGAAEIATQSPYIIVEDVDAHHARAVAAGATVVSGPMDPGHGGRFYACRDPEGHLWNFGSYDPWAPVA